MDYINLYSDYLCKEPIKQVFCGLAGLAGDWADLENGGKWSRTGSGQTPETFCYSAVINGEQAAGEGGVKNVVFSGGAEIFNVSFLTSPIYADHALITDQFEPGGSTIPNAFFISSDAENRQSWCLRISAEIGYFGDATVYPLTYRYNQTPYDGERQYWEYTRDAGSQTSIETPQTTQFGGIYLYSVTVGDVDYYLLLVGAGAGGTLHPTNSSFMLLIPTVYFVDQIPKPYVGPVSKDSAATSFIPTTPYHDSIAGRDLTGKRNPIGFNSGNGLRLLQLDNAGYSQILYGIYSGSSSSLLNYAGQLIDQVTGGEGHRPAEEVQPMTQGVLCCHIVPAIATYGSGIYNLKSIAGYRLSLAGVPGLLCAQHIYSYTSPAVSVAPRLNSFLDYEPYTSIICHLPFFGDISVSPSAMLGNAIQAEYELDIYTGILSCNLFIITPESRYIISTQQSKISTDLPVIGAAANQNAIGTIAQATGGLARARMQQARAQEIGTQAEQAAAAANTAASAAAGAITTVDALSRAGNAVPVGGSSVEGIGNYLVSRAAYLIITRPQPSLPENFAQLYGAVSNIAGTVSSFAGYTEFSAVDLRGIDATDAEKAQILALLRGGVFV